jgi:hypothetical protein
MALLYGRAGRLKSQHAGAQADQAAAASTPAPSTLALAATMPLSGAKRGCEPNPTLGTHKRRREDEEVRLVGLRSVVNHP